LYQSGSPFGWIGVCTFINIPDYLERSLPFLKKKKQKNSYSWARGKIPAMASIVEPAQE
jgi:hypothetical protein